MALPFTVAAGVVLLDRRTDGRLKRRLPISSKVLRSAGDSLRARLEVLNEDIDSNMLCLVLLGPMTIGCWALIHVEWATLEVGITEIILLIGLLAGSVWWTGGLLRAIRLRRFYREGLIAERYTAQELNRLTATGCAVFHDVPGEHFNIDHVVVGNATVFAVETKSRRKADGRDGHRVKYDGERLVFPDHASAKPLEQAEKNARWLAKHLEAALGRVIPVVPVVALPGWFIDSTREAGSARVRVMPVGGKSAHFMVDARHSPDPNFRNMVRQAIAML